MHARARHAFTLVEILIVVVIIGILAAIVIPRFNNARGKSLAAALKNDLRNLAVAQEDYFYTVGGYTSDVAKLNYSASPGVTIEIVTATDDGWAAKATHPQAYPLTCAIFWGPVPALAPAEQEGLINCQ
jgi:type IV pilus assembly protein PilA